MKQYEIRVEGNVQRAGYRDIVRKAAAELGFTGYVENMSDYSVKIVCVGSEEKFEEFLNRIRIVNRLIEVQHIKVARSEPTEHFDYFKIKRGNMTDELGERLDTAIDLFKEMNERMDRGFTEVKEAVSEVKEEVSEMREEMHTGFTEVKEEVSEMREEMHTGFTEVKEEIHGMHTGMDKNFNRLDGKYHTVTEELGKIRKAVVKGLNIEEEDVE